jgi:mannose-6-phosphate isomerase-like protein (cupin superfamily)
MKYLLYTLAFAVVWQVGKTQVLDYHQISIDTTLAVQVKRLAGDDKVSSFVIVVNDSVQAHFHQNHAEHVYVLEGSGSMRLGDQRFEVKAGDFVFIPQGVIHAVRPRKGQALKVLSIQAPAFDGSDRVLVPQK